MTDPASQLPPTEVPPPEAVSIPGLTDFSGALPPNARIGNYRLLRIIGGGMDVVFEAEQLQPQRVVALKLMRAFAHLPARTEPQILARLAHPNVAQVYEAGTVNLGGQQVSYFAMEYVPGARTICEFARDQLLSRRERIDLFANVCDALHHGHLRGVLHLDLKPQNILVDLAGRVKVIDFGIAHAIGSETARDVDGERRLIGTPQYMSPEQCRLETPQLDARSDVYSLGLVLYELLCARVPYVVRSTTVEEITRSICEQEPAPPSEFDAIYAGDGDAILGASLAKDRDARYASAGALRDDLRRWLRCEPVEARGRGTLYSCATHVRRFVTRHVISTALAAAAVAFVLAAYFASEVVFSYTPINAWFEGVITSGSWPASTAELRGVRIIEITDDAKLLAAARRLRIDSFDPKDPRTLRPLHGALLKRLSGSGARVVAFDVVFASPTEWDDAFVAGAQELERAGIPLVVGMSSWRLDGAGRPKISPAIAAVSQWGGVGARFGGDGAWMLPLVYQHLGEPPVPSLSLAAVCAARDPKAEFMPDIDTAALALNVYPYHVDPQTHARVPAGPAQRIRFTVLHEEPKDDPNTAASAGARSAQFVLNVPTDDVFRRSAVEYADVLGMSDESLRQLCHGMVIVIGDRRHVAGDGPFAHPDGRRLHGVYGQAVGIEALLHWIPIRLTSLWLDLVAALIGGGVALVIDRNSRVRWGVLVVLSVVAVGVSLVAYREFQYVRNPAVGIIAMWLASELTAFAGRARRRALLIS